MLILKSAFVEQMPELTTNADDAALRPWKAKRDVVFSIYLGSAWAFGYAGVALQHHPSWVSTGWMVEAIFQLVLIVLWCGYDARFRVFPLTGFLRLTILLLVVVGVPWYLVRTRGWRGAALIGFGLPAYLLTMLLHFVGALAALSTRS